MGFEAQLSLELKERGMKGAALSRRETLKIARRIAAEIGARQGACDADDVAAEMKSRGLDYSILGNAAGSIFLSKKWSFEGQRIKSKRASAHARDIKVWLWNGTCQDED